jgi:hypothetical protein
MPFFGLTEPARRPEMLPTTDRVAQLTAVRSATNFRTALHPEGLRFYVLAVLGRCATYRSLRLPRLTAV